MGINQDDWTAPPVDRREPPQVNGERAALETWLDYQRDTLFTKCAGLTADQLKQRAVPPSKLSLLGLVRHMTEVERWWFSIHAADRDMPLPYSTEDNMEADFDELDTADAAADLASLHREIDASRAAVASKDLNDVVHSHGHNKEETFDIRWIYVHMVEEYARHNGHADLIRERVDGATGD